MAAPQLGFVTGLALHDTAAGAGARRLPGAQMAERSAVRRKIAGILIEAKSGCGRGGIRVNAPSSGCAGCATDFAWRAPCRRPMIDLPSHMGAPRSMEPWCRHAGIGPRLAAHGPHIDACGCGAGDDRCPKYRCAVADAASGTADLCRSRGGVPRSDRGDGWIDPSSLSTPQPGVSHPSRGSGLPCTGGNLDHWRCRERELVFAPLGGSARSA
jgi:hypothetical protein